MMNKSIKVQLPPAGSPCQEADPRSAGSFYVPCGKPATRLVWSKDHKPADRIAYPMCAACTDHSVKNRGAKIVEQGEKYTLATIGMPPTVEENPRFKQKRLNDLHEKLKRSAEHEKAKAETSPLPNTSDPALLVDDMEENPEGPTDEQRRQVTEIAKEAMLIEDTIVLKQEDIKSLQERLSLLLEAELPASMKLIGQTKVPLLGGAEVQLLDILKASILLANKDTAHRWLEQKDVGGAPLVKRQIIIEFGMGEEAWAKKFMRDMAQRKKPLNAVYKETVHPASLDKFVKEKKAAGKDIDTSINIYEATVAKIKRPKASKPVEGM